MEKMFYGCKELTSIDISNFYTTKVTNMDSMFEGCSKLEYINFKNAQVNTNNYNKIFDQTVKNLVLCTTDTKLKTELEKNTCAVVDCSQNWKEKQSILIDSSGTCTDKCYASLNLAEYNHKCYSNCISKPKNIE